tara:strand:- start:1798 stop:2013 length:216 start_codon:yes stop_codon:yes gene_type:complete
MVTTVDNAKNIAAQSIQVQKRVMAYLTYFRMHLAICIVFYIVTYAITYRLSQHIFLVNKDGKGNGAAANAG